MKHTKLSLRRPEGETVDVVVTAYATATVGDVARALALGRPDDREAVSTTPGTSWDAAGPDDLDRSASAVEPAALTLAVLDGDRHQVLDPGLVFGEAPIPAGATVTVAEHASVDLAASPTLATVTVLNGPDRGRTIPVRAATCVIGRGAECDVRLSDPLISRRHARLVVTGVVTLVDLNSANGILSGGEVVRRIELGPRDVVVLGETSISVASHGLLDPAEVAAGGGVGFNRSPQVHVAFPEQSLVAPVPPQPPDRHRFPLISLLIPLLLAGALYAVFPSPFLLVFLAMSPLLLLGQWLEQRVGGARDHRLNLRQFREDVVRLKVRLGESDERQRLARRADHPDALALARAVVAREPLLWSRHPDRGRWLELRVGLGRRPSFTAVTLPMRNAAPAALWEELEQIAERAAWIEPVPVVVPLAACGVFGIAGGSVPAQALADAVVLQLIGLHSPAELVLTLLTDGAGAERWSWLRWLPHTSSEHSPLVVPHLAGDEGSAKLLLATIEDLVIARLEQSSRPTAVLPVVVVVMDDGAPVERARANWVATNGPGVGVHLIHVAPSRERLLAACGMFVDVDVDASGTGWFGDGTVGEVVHPVRLETLEPGAVERVARACSPLVDIGAAVRGGVDLPANVPLLTLCGSELASDPAPVVDRWVRTGSVEDDSGHLRTGHHQLAALVGVSSDGPFYLDLRTQGPHALVGGTTGAGKSEFLQSWVVGLATTYSPRRVTFLFVDYKGGAAFGDCTRLPHSVGMITDLTPNLFARTLISLRAELRRREQILGRRKAKDLVELERRADPEAPPSLVIVVDEFAALAKDVPEFVDGMVDIAQRGRSLGVHLILATQRPAGVIKENLRANTNLRVALRMADTMDSTDVLGAPDSGLVSPDLPGRGYVRTGPGRLTAFQTGYSGGWTSEVPEPATVTVETLRVGLPHPWRAPAPVQAAPRIDRSSPTDLQRMVATIAVAADRQAIPAPTPPWLPPLSPTYRWEDLDLVDGSDVLPLAQRDDPMQQAQYAVGFDPDREGNLAVFGTGGSGKSTLLRTVATAAFSRTREAGPTHVYAIDFGAGGLSMIDGLPNVGAVIDGDDVERIGRLIRWLTETIRERSARFVAVRAGTLGEYRERAAAPEEPRILLLVDGCQVFRQRHEGRSGVWEQFIAVAADGRSVGIHVCLAADRPLSVPGALQSVIQKRVFLRMVEDDYLAAGLAGQALPAGAPPGRGHLDGYEVQVAVLRGRSSIAVQARDLVELAAGKVGPAAAVGTSPHPIRTLPEFVTLAELPAELAGAPVIGLADDDLQPAAVPIRSTFLVAGPPGSGRTTALVAVAAACLRSGTYGRAVYLGGSRSPVHSWLPWDRVGLDHESVRALATELVPVLADPRTERHLVVVEGLADVATGANEPALLALAKVCSAFGHAFVTDVDLSAKMFTELFMLLKAGRQGLVLRPGNAIDGQNLLFTNTPPPQRADVRGRGVLVSDGIARSVQVAVPPLPQSPTVVGAGLPVLTP